MADESNENGPEGEGASSIEERPRTEPPAAAEAAPEGADEDAPAAEDDAPEARIARYKDQLLRAAADFDNFRKRAKRDTEDAERRGREDMLRELLPVIDNLERAVAAADTAKDVAAVSEGVRMVLRQFEDVGGKLGIERIPTVGARFDPSLHDAVQQQETDEHPPGTIVSEVVPGYRMGNRLVRAALVVVARPPSTPSAEPGTESGA